MISYLQNKINLENLIKLEKYLLLGLILMIPYHYLIVCIFLEKLTFLRIWKEILIVILTVLIFLQILVTNQKIKFNAVDLISILFILIDILYIFISPNIKAAINISRIYITPIMLVFIIRYIPLTQKDIYIAMKYIIINTFIISLYGIIQQNLLGDKFLIQIGYPLNTQYDYKRLNDSFYMTGANLYQRNSSTFVSPNVAAIYFSFVLSSSIILFKYININKKFLISMICTIFISLILTFSRTGWIVTTIGVILICIFSIKWNRKKILLLIKGIISFVIVALCLDIILLNGKMTFFIINLIYSTLTLQDNSINSHLESLRVSLYIASTHILGCGLGSNGPRAISYFAEPLLTESSYFLLFFEVGIIGVISYFLIYIISIYKLIKNIIKFKEDIFFVLLIIIIETLIAFISLPYIQDVEITYITFICLGMIYCFKKNKISKGEKNE